MYNLFVVFFFISSNIKETLILLTFSFALLNYYCTIIYCFHFIIFIFIFNYSTILNYLTNFLFYYT